MKRPLLAGLTILIAWMLLDVLLHRLFLAPLYEASRERAVRPPSGRLTP